MINIYNSLTNKIEPFKPIIPNQVSIYYCGPTVYGYAHIGNSRPIIVYDTIRRIFTYLGYKVQMISNYTDIDDKIIKRAIEENITEKEVANFYIAAYEKLVKDTNSLPHDFNPRVSQNINQIIEFIQKLIDNGSAYVVDGEVYFEVLKAPHYGILSGQNTDNLLNGVRIEENISKRSPLDFALWKKTSVGITWDSPWGRGRPGWHTECVVMINDYFKGPIDIHGGGADLKFPHHDNEIAQSECVNHNYIANYWMHCGRLGLKDQQEKMSKSLGNVIWAHDLVKELGYQAYRLLFLNVPYRQPLNFFNELKTQCINDVEKINRAYISLYRKIELNGDIKETTITNDELLNIKNEFINFISDDFNTPNAITTIFKVVKLINQYIRQKELDINYANELLSLYYGFLYTLGIEYHIEPLTNEQKQLVIKWQTARNNKDFSKADELRQLITEQGLVL